MISNSEAVHFTVAIPTYNGEKTLPLVLEKLRSQITPETLSWEVIIIDNNSTDRTAETIASWQANFPVPLHYHLETKQGSAYARQKAVQMAQGEWIGFLDDDNLPDSCWVSAAYHFGTEHSKAGVIGGQIHGKYEIDPPLNFDRAKGFLVIRKYAQAAKQFEPEKLRLPPGAGLVVRRQAWIESMPNRFVRAHRGGHDYEISLRIYKQGWQIWYNPEMEIEHLIPAWRMEKAYLNKIARIYGLCTCEIRLILARSWQKPILLIRSFLGGLKHTMLHLIRHRQRAFSDLGLSCETAFFIGSMLSPFEYIWKQIDRLRVNLIARAIDGNS
ncbi:hormogonium polysaccharide biosynthesis glycosyltransferase HpsE [Leptolyngbya ohadii]|uniref:hormogonium polysaccharide biosynthesis glycosyltransferase HpsE n=1 Tax=Leptolyngbya ohadii TaxID=1962290 RepID=UPI000B5A004D|nr:hormogonium polysaccharide biosynthesis glycosyltransferase HpsE [Leptolyngbya ohadii]